jgi:hypothetical protein
LRGLVLCALLCPECVHLGHDLRSSSFPIQCLAAPKPLSAAVEQGSNAGVGLTLAAEFSRGYFGRPITECRYQATRNSPMTA